MDYLRELMNALDGDSAFAYAPPHAGRPFTPFLLHNLNLTPIANNISILGVQAPFLERAIELGLAPGVFADSEVIPFDSLEGTVYHDQLLAPMGWRDRMQFVLRAPGPREAGLVFAVQRHVGKRLFGPGDIAFARRQFAPLAEAAQGSFVASPSPPRMPPRTAMVLEGFSTACVIFGANGGVIHVNRAARRILGEEDGLMLRGGAVTAADPRAARALARAIAGALSAASAEPIEIPIVRAKRQSPLLAVVTAVADGGDWPFSDDVAAAMYILDVEAQACCSGQARRSQVLFGLTDAEAMVLSQFLQGLSLEQIALARATSLATVRTQMKTILHKTHSTHQRELLRLRRLEDGLPLLRQIEREHAPAPAPGALLRH